MESKIKKITISIFIIIIIIIIFSLGIYIFNEEKKNIVIDEYNLSQAEKIRNVIIKYDKNSYSFKDLNEFNQTFNQNIKPIIGQNCYYLSDRNRYFVKDFDSTFGSTRAYLGLNEGGGYTFGFQLKSRKYKKMYLSNYHSVPVYDLPIYIECTSKCYDKNFQEFKWIISNICKE